jgi:hypothetical protein
LSTAGVTSVRALLSLKLARAPPGDELHAPKVEHYHDRGESFERLLVHVCETSATLEPRLFCFSDYGRSGPRSVSSSQTLYRKKPEK